MLRPDGVFLVSTPRADATTERPDNPFHLVEYSREDFERLLRRPLRLGRALRPAPPPDPPPPHAAAARRGRPAPAARRSCAAASVLVGTPPTAEATLDDLVIERGDLDRASELVAVCTGPADA